MEDLAGIGKVVDSEIVKRTYDDALSPGMHEVGELLGDSLKAFRLFTAPIQLIAAYQDRLAHFCDRVRNKVPEEHQCEAAPEIARPVMEAFAYTNDDSPLMKMFEELMAQAIDQRQAEKLSPLFAPLIQNLSPLEAKLISSLKIAEQTTDALYENERQLLLGRYRTNFSFDDFGGADHHLTIVQNLMQKNLVSTLKKALVASDIYPDINLESGQQIIQFTYRLSMFGQWFANSCVPRGGVPSNPR